MKIRVLIVSVILCLCSQIAAADNFMIPKSFSAEIKELQNAPQEKPPIVNIISPVVAPVRSASVNKQTSKPILMPKTAIPQLTTVPTTISLTELIRNYKYNYTKTLVSTLVTLEELNLGSIRFDSSKGQIIVSTPGGNDIFILLLPAQDNLTYVRITPADGQYRFSRELINNIFSRIASNIGGEL